MTTAPAMHPRLRILASLAAIGLLLSLAAKYLLPMAAPLLLGLILAVTIEPMVRKLENSYGFSRRLAVGSILAIVSLGGLALLALLGAEIWSFLQRFILAEGGRSLLGSLERLADGAAGSMAAWPPPFGRIVPDLLRELPRLALAAAEMLLLSLGRFWEWGIIFALGLMAASFFCRRRSHLARALWTLVPSEWRRPAAAMRDELLEALSGYLRSLWLMFLLTACVGAIGLRLLGIKPAFLLGAVLGLLDILPLLGPGSLLLPWAGVLWVMGRSSQAWGLLALFIALAVGREAAQARLIGGRFGLPPLAVLSAVYIGIKLYGAAGVAIGPFILLILRGLYLALARSAPSDLEA